MQNVLWRVRNGVLNQAPIKVIVLLIGTNNVSNRFSPDEVSQGIGCVLDAIHAQLPQSKILPDGLHVAGPGFDRWFDPMDQVPRSLLAAP